MNAYETQDYTLVRSLNCDLQAVVDGAKRHEWHREVLKGRSSMKGLDAWQQCYFRAEAQKLAEGCK